MLFVREFPDEAMLLDIARRFSSVKPEAVRACLALCLVGRDMRDAFGRFLARYGLSDGRFITLMTMYRDPQRAVAPSELAYGVGVTRGSMTGILDELERDGLVAREADPADRRRKRARLTGHGLDLLRRLTPEYCRRTTHFSTCLSAQEWGELSALLERLQGGIARFEAADEPPA
ncbi:MAG: MarR family transcriptional regulator [Desulfovibrionaceae bacterium]|jgi:DNA-binding MarR family transcriptional regulator|nr:MarR family transcriptional regulator [Desulfovibrionaceae bacterium]